MTAEKYVLLEITDTGTGMTDEVKKHLFEPFFTTKPKEKGTGLGLAIAKHAVERHGGTIAFESIVNEGTTFTVTLPYSPSA